MTFGSTFGRVFSPTFQPKSQAAASSADTWWDLNGTITSCVAAYQPKGAASYAASKVNLVNPGTDNLSDGTAYPSWSSGGAWDFIGDTARWLVTPNTLGLMSIAISYVWTYEGAGSYPTLMMNPAAGYWGSYRIRRSGTSIETAANAFHTGGSRYINGTDTAAITFDSRQTLVSNAASTITQKYIIGCSLASYSLNANIYAVAFYNAALSQAQAAALATAMNAL